MLAYRLDDQGGPQPQPGWKEPNTPHNPDEDKQGDEQEEKPQ